MFYVFHIIHFDIKTPYYTYYTDFMDQGSEKPVRNQEQERSKLLYQHQMRQDKQMLESFANINASPTPANTPTHFNNYTSNNYWDYNLSQHH